MKKVVKNIADGVRGIDQTVSEMWRLVNRDVKNPSVRKIASSLKGSDEIETAKNCFNYTWKNFEYKSDPEGIEHFTAPVYLLSKEFSKHLDCDDLVGILAVLLLANNIPVRFKTIQWRRNDFTHIILDFKYGNSWIPCDPVKKSDGFGNQIIEAINGATFKQKIYSNPMGTLVTLEDCNNCGGSGQKHRVRQPDNQNIILIGNSADKFSSLDLKSNGSRQAQPVQIPVMRSADVQPQVVEKVVEKAVPYPVYRKIAVPTRSIQNPNFTNYREFY